MIIESLQKVARFIAGGSQIESRLRDLRHAVPQPSEVEKGRALVSRWKTLNQHGSDLGVPNRRRRVIEALHGMRVEDLEGDDTIDAQRAVLEHNPEAILRVHQHLKALQVEIEKEAEALLQDFHRRHAPDIAAELAKARAKFEPLFAFHGCDGEHEGTRPIQTLAQEHQRYAAGGALNFGHNGPGPSFAHWGVTTE